MAQLAESREPARYTSIGCGGMLTDFEILCGLSEKGVEIEAIDLVDSIYSGDMWTPAFKLLASFFAPARVAAYASMVHRQRAAEKDPALHGRVTTFVHCDAENIEKYKSRELATKLLVPGGHSFQLHNEGVSRSSRECFRAPPRSGVDAGPTARKPLQEVHVAATAGEEPLLDAKHVARQLGARLFRVVFGSNLFVRAAPVPKGRVVGIRPPGAEVIVDRVSEGWARLSEHDPYVISRGEHIAPRASFDGDEAAPSPAAWMMIHGERLGLGTLLEEVPLHAAEADEGWPLRARPCEGGEPHAEGEADDDARSDMWAEPNGLPTGGAGHEGAGDATAEDEFDWDMF